MSKISAEEKEATRLRILEATRKIFRATGYEKTQIKEVAKEAGIGTSTIYGYYSSKPELFVSAFIDEMLVSEFDEAIVQEALKQGITKGLMELLFTNRIEDIERDREVLGPYIIASMYDSRTTIIEKKLHNRIEEYDYIKSVLEIYERTNVRLCAFSLNHLAQSILTIVEYMGIEYMVGNLSRDEVETRIEDQFKVILAGKYENL